MIHYIKVLVSLFIFLFCKGVSLVSCLGERWRFSFQLIDGKGSFE